MRPSSSLSEALLERFRDTRRAGRIDDPDARGEAVSVVCGDRVELTLRLASGRVADARFQAQGCAVAIASASAAASVVVGRAAVAGTVGFEELDRLLGGIPRGRQSCARASLSALDAALAAPGSTGRR